MKPHLIWCLYHYLCMSVCTVALSAALYIFTLSSKLCISCSKSSILLFYFTAIFRANQSIFLDKRDPDSRMKTAQAIRTRAEAKGAWPQLLVYPEGMIGNQTCLLPFKLGELLGNHCVLC